MIYANGIRNLELRTIALFKVHKARSRSEQFTLEQLITYMHNKELARPYISNSSSKSSSESNSEQTVPSRPAINDARMDNTQRYLKPHFQQFRHNNNQYNQNRNNNNQTTALNQHLIPNNEFKQPPSHHINQQNAYEATPRSHTAPTTASINLIDSTHNFSKEKSLYGKALFNNTLVEYFFDSGASRTVISRDLFEKIKFNYPQTKLGEYKGKHLRSANGPLKIMGVLKLNSCILSEHR